MRKNIAWAFVLSSASIGPDKSNRESNITSTLGAGFLCAKELYRVKFKWFRYY